MDEKITLQGLSAKLAENTGNNKKQCEDFLREFFTTISEVLATGENVKIKGLGTFRIINVSARKSVDVNTGESIEIPAHNKIVFSASKELADEVNEPFSIFESVELEDSVDEGDFENLNGNEKEILASESSDIQDSTDMKVSDAGQTYILEDSYSVGSNDNTQIIEKTNDVADPGEDAVISEENHSVNYTMKKEEVLNSEDTSDEHEKIERESDSSSEQYSPLEQDAQEEEAEETYIYEDETSGRRKRRFSFMMGFACGLAFTCVVCLVLWYVYFQNVDLGNIFGGKGKKDSVETVIVPSKTVADNKALSDSLSVIGTDSVVRTNREGMEVSEQVSTQPSDMPVRYDTISKTRYLTTMAQQYYGNFNLWPYIYEENKAFLGHPDRIKPGTKVVIPPLSKYGVDPKNNEDIKKAKKMGQEIYAKYNK